MSFRKFNVVDELKTAAKAVKAGMRPCSVCQGRLMAVCVDRALSYYKELEQIARAGQRRERRIQRAKRVGNLIMFPKLAK